jgi:glucosamine 6-phosphate synthetase-like amidotransferase/phosphosugar isomerase protein
MKRARHLSDRLQNQPSCRSHRIGVHNNGGRAAVPVVAPQFILNLPAVSHEDVGLFISQSGAKDVLSMRRLSSEAWPAAARQRHGSTLTSGCAVPALCCGYEISVPATKTFLPVLTFLTAYRMAGRNTRN